MGHSTIILTNVEARPTYCPWCGANVAGWGHDDTCPTRTAKGPKKRRVMGRFTGWRRG